jgi:hypothetical protein
MWMEAVVVYFNVLSCTPRKITKTAVTIRTGYMRSMQVYTATLAWSATATRKGQVMARSVGITSHVNVFE